MTIPRLAVAVATAALLLTGCSTAITGEGEYERGSSVGSGTASTGSTQPDYTDPDTDTYPQLGNRTVTETIREVGSADLNKYTDGQIVELARAACSDFDKGNTLAQTIADGDNTGLVHDDVLTIVFTAVLGFCPQYDDLLPH